MNNVLAQIERSNLKELAALRTNPEFIDKPLSISRIQWYMKIGYNHASRLLKAGIDDGILILNKDTPSAAKFSELGSFHKQCNDCGVFVKKEMWIDKASKHKHYALCSPCMSNYDDTECDNTM